MDEEKELANWQLEMALERKIRDVATPHVLNMVVDGVNFHQMFRAVEEFGLKFGVYIIHEPEGNWLVRDNMGRDSLRVPDIDAALTHFFRILESKMRQQYNGS